MAARKIWFFKRTDYVGARDPSNWKISRLTLQNLIRIGLNLTEVYSFSFVLAIIFGYSSGRNIWREMVGRMHPKLEIFIKFRFFSKVAREFPGSVWDVSWAFEDIAGWQGLIFGWRSASSNIFKIQNFWWAFMMLWHTILGIWSLSVDFGEMDWCATSHGNLDVRKGSTSHTAR